MKEFSNNSTMNKFGYFFVGCLIFGDVLSFFGLFFKDETIEILIGIALISYAIKVYLPWILFKRKIYIDHENDKIINQIGYEEDIVTREYVLSEIKDYNIIKIAKANEIRAKDPTLIIPNDAGTRAFHSLGYVTFENDDVLCIEYGSKRKIRKRIAQFKSCLIND